MYLDWSSYATKTDLKNETHVDVSNFALKTNPANLKTEVDTIDIVKLTPIPDDLDKLGNVVKDDVAKKTEYNKLVKKVYNIDTTGFVLKTTYDTDKSDLENKVSDQLSQLKKTDLNAKITEIENKIPSITELATNLALTAVENKIPNVSNLATKTDHNTKITEIEKKVSDHNHDKYITTPEFNKLTTKNLKARLAQANLIKKKQILTLN